MLVAFIGSPCSGKTTAAARLFAELKDSGQSAEFLPEHARSYIAEKRLRCMKKNEDFSLNDADQTTIFYAQLAAELTMKEACGDDAVVIADSCAVNSLFYMADVKQKESAVAMAAADHYCGDSTPGELWKNGHYDLVFICEPVAEPLSTDPNRVHSYRDSLRIHAGIPEVLHTYAPSLVPRVLRGNSSARSKQALYEVMQRAFGGVS